MAKVLYKQGSKASYLGLYEKNPNALYFCTDTRELFKGGDLISDGFRIVSSYENLPSFGIAADGIVYFCESNGCGYILNSARDGWTPVIHGVDGTSIGVSAEGMLYVKGIQIESISGLNEKLQEIQKVPLTGSDGVSISEEGVISISDIDISKIKGLEERLAKIEENVSGGGSTDDPSDPSEEFEGFEVVEF